jgi:periplasmic protein TonB
MPHSGHGSTHGVLALAIAFALLSASACSSAAVDPPAGPEELCAAMVQPPVPKADSSNPDIQAPVVIRRVEPVVGRALRGRAAVATVEAVIGEDGQVRNVCVSSGDPEWGRAVATALRKWQFKPGTKDGKPVPVLFSLTSTWGPR